MPIVRITRRGALALGGGAAAAGVTGALGLGSEHSPASRRAASSTVLSQRGRLPVVEIQNIVEAEGLISDGVLTINVARDDLGSVEGPLGITFTGSFGLVGTLGFQPLGDDLAFFSGDLPVRSRENDPFIDAIIANGLTFQAFHQSFSDMRPQIFSIHWRGVGNPLRLAQSVRNVLRTTKMRLPQTQPQGPQSPLDAEHLAEILHGGAQIGGEGVVTVNVSRRDRLEIAGVHVSSTFATSTSIAFKPRSAKGALADVAPGFAMRGVEVQRVIGVMREQGWLVSGLASHATQESPQLYFAQMLKAGDAYTLAGEIRRGLDRTDSAD